MLIAYEDLLRLPAATLDNLIREYLLSQIEDGSFLDWNDDGMQTAILRCRQALKRGELLVQYSEEEESVAIRSREEILRHTPIADD